MNTIGKGLATEKAWLNYMANCKQVTHILQKPGRLPFDAQERAIFWELCNALEARKKELACTPHS